MALYRNIAGTGEGMGRTIDDINFTRFDGDGGGGGFVTYNPTSVAQPADVVFYDPGYVGYPEPAVVYDVRENQPVIPIQELTPVPSPDVQTMADPVEDIATTVEVPNGTDTKNIFPLLTLALLAATMVKGEDLFGSSRGVVFAGGLGLLYYQLSKRAAVTAD